MSMLYFLDSMGYSINARNSSLPVVAGLIVVVIFFITILYIEKKLGWIKGS
jgi:hypothetical protein